MTLGEFIPNAPNRNALGGVSSSESAGRQSDLCPAIPGATPFTVRIEYVS